MLGPGGVGKTRLAIEAARGLLLRFAAGVAYIPLDAIAVPAMVPMAIFEGVRAAGVIAPDDQVGRGDPAAALVRCLHDRQALLVLDNCEHILPGVVFDASWQELGAEEQQVFERLAVFRNGCDRTAAARVAGADLTTLAALLDRSWLRRRPDGRYEIHELLRQYGGERLDEQPRLGAAARDRHSRYYLEWLSQRTEDLKGKRQVAALQEIRCIPYSFALGDLSEVTLLTGEYAEGERVARANLDSLRRADNRWAIPFALGRLGLMCYAQGDRAGAQALLQEGLALVVGLEPLAAARVLNRLGQIALALGDLGEAEHCHTRALAHAQGRAHPQQIATAQAGLGHVAYARGDWAQGVELCTAALAGFSALGARCEVATRLAQLPPTPSRALYAG